MDSTLKSLWVWVSCLKMQINLKKWWIKTLPAKLSCTRWTKGCSLWTKKRRTSMSSHKLMLNKTKATTFINQIMSYSMRLMQDKEGKMKKRGKESRGKGSREITNRLMRSAQAVLTDIFHLEIDALYLKTHSTRIIITPKMGNTKTMSLQERILNYLQLMFQELRINTSSPIQIQVKRDQCSLFAWRAIKSSQISIINSRQARTIPV